MDRRSWPWKKKSSEKNVAASEPLEAAAVNSAQNNDDQEASKAQDTSKALEEYAHRYEEAMTQLQESEEKVKSLNEKLSAALLEINTKESLVKEHAKVAEELMSGWEQTGAEARASKQQAESLKQQKVALEDRVAHLDGALKECMRQLRHVKEEQEHKLHETVVNKTREWENIRFEFEAKIMALEQQLLQAGAENTVISRSLQERTKTVGELNEARSQAEAEVKVLQVNIESYEHDMSSLKYELHVLSKELEIRNEEKNMSMKSADAANKQHLEAVKKIAKLEAECQRLRSLVRKKLPGPAALAQMKMEVETLGKEMGEGRRRRSPAKSRGSFVSHSFDSGYDSQDQGQKESEFLTERLLAMEEETKMLKEALAKRNGELQASRTLCARTASKLSSLEKQLEVLNNDQKQRKPALELHIEGPRSQTASNPPSLTSMSEDGNDDEVSCAESWASALISELSQIKKEKDLGRTDKSLESEKVDLMDDFAEMERLASLPSPKMDQTTGKLDVSSKKSIVGGEDKTSLEETVAKRDSELQSANQLCSDLSKKLTSVQEELAALQSKNNANENALASLQARLDTIFEVHVEGGDAHRVLEVVKRAMTQTGGVLTSSDSSTKQLLKDPLPSHDLDNQYASQFTERSMEEEEDISPSDAKFQIDVTEPKLESLVSGVVTLLEFIAKKARSSQKFPASKVHDLNTSFEKFTKSLNHLLNGKVEIIQLITTISSVLTQLSEICVPAFGEYDVQNEANGDSSIIPDIDKSIYFDNVDLKPSPLEEKITSTAPLSLYSSGPNADGELRVIQAEKTALESEVKAGLARHAILEEELTQLKTEKDTLRNQLEDELTRVRTEKDNLRNELMASKEELKQTKDKLTETEDMLANLREQLASTQESKQLAENQLETMTSVKADLESQLKATEIERNQLCETVKALESELQEEHKRYDDAEAKFQDLQEQLQRKDEELASSHSSVPDNDLKSRQQREIAAAAEKIAECQQTILILGRQLKALSSPKDSMDWSYDIENGQSSSGASPLVGQESFSQNTKHSRHHLLDASDCVCQSSEGNGRFEQCPPSNSQSASGASEPDMSGTGNHRQKSSQLPGRTAPDSYKNNEPISPVNADYSEGHSTVPSSSDTEASPPAESPVKSTRQRNRIPRSLAGNALSKSLNAGEGKSSSSSSEKHGSGFSRFFSRTRSTSSQ